MFNISRRLYDEYDGDKKKVALIIKDHKLAKYGFYAIKDMNLSFDEYFKSLNYKSLLDMIPEYTCDRVLDHIFKDKSPFKKINEE